jgi:hypothetical protein
MGVQLGVFARRSVARYGILCEYQGVRLTTPAGCAPWVRDPGLERTAYLM